MSMDTMLAHDEGIEEAREAVLKILKRSTCGEEGCKVCAAKLKWLRRINTELTRLRETPR